jgi:hypothetical protein
MELEQTHGSTMRRPSSESATSDLRSEPAGGTALAETGWSAISTDWDNRKAALGQEWSLLTDEDIEGIDGNRLSLLERLQTRYGWTAEESSSQIDMWVYRAGARSRFRPGQNVAEPSRHLA